MHRVAIVTGGTRGIGAAISVALKNKGYRVAANYGVNDTAALQFQADTGIPSYKFDVADYAACEQGVQQIVKDFGPVDILVNNAGITCDAMLHRMSRESWDAVRRHARAQLWPHHQHLLRQWPEGPGRSGQLFGGKGGAPRLHEGRSARRGRQGDHLQRYPPRPARRR
jgi:NAD(P)-dependent dehydrogenase (short-subunit alcohol dehydrogenase family)